MFQYKNRWSYLLKYSKMGAKARLPAIARIPRIVKIKDISDPLVFVISSRSIREGPMMPRLSACNQRN